MSNIFNDLKKTDLIRNDYLAESFDKIYFSSNENLKGICSNFNFYGKNILTVLSSGDQAFHLYNSGAQNIDFFDMNKFTLYYYYLRVWIIKYKREFYPPVSINNAYIIDILRLVEKNEDINTEAYNFWYNFVKYYSDEPNAITTMFKEKPIFSNNIDDLDQIIESVSCDNVAFYNYDIAGEKKINKKYDVVYISNIPQWCYHRLEILTSNLIDLVNENGIIIRANLRHGPGEYEKRIFRKKFIFTELSSIYSKRLDRDLSPGYYLRKK